LYSDSSNEITIVINLGNTNEIAILGLVNIFNCIN